MADDEQELEARVARLEDQADRIMAQLERLLAELRHPERAREGARPT